MRLTLCTKRDIFGCLILNWLLPRLAEHDVVVLLSDKTRPNEESVAELAELKLLERDLPLQVIFPLLNQSTGGHEGRLLTFEQLTEHHATPIHTVQQINDGDGFAILQTFKPDLILSARFSLIFKQPAIDLPRHGIYNIHPGELPRYGGLFAPMRALQAGDKKLGCTLHRIDAGIDSGPIHSIAYLEAASERSLFWHVAHLYPLGLANFLEVIALLERGQSVPLTLQNPALREYRSMPGTKDFAAFRAKGGALVKPQDYLDCLEGFGSRQQPPH